MNFFDYLNAINVSKENVMVDDIAEKAYNAFMVNRGLSYFSDTVLLANEMNRFPHLDARLQFDFAINTVRKRKRFSKWFKAISPEDLAIVKVHYGYSNAKARVALSLLSKAQIEILKAQHDTGGLSKKPNSGKSASGRDSSGMDSSDDAGNLAE